MIPRLALREIETQLTQLGCVLLVGPQEVGKSALARIVASRVVGDVTILEMQKESHRQQLREICTSDAPRGELVIIDDVQHMPEAFDLLRTQIEARIHEGRQSSPFLVMGSSLEVKRLAADKLGTRSGQHCLTPIQLLELSGVPDVGASSGYVVEEAEGPQSVIAPSPAIGIDTLWLRGGFPDSLTASSEAQSFEWRRRYLHNVCNLSLPPGLVMSAASVRYVLEMIASRQGEIATKFDSDQRWCLTHFESLDLVRLLQPWFVNRGKRLTKSPKAYIRDSGLLHCLLGCQSLAEVKGDGVLHGHSWEGFCVESLILAAKDRARSYFYRADDDDEIDLVLEFSADVRWAVEIKAGGGSASGFESACNEIGAAERIVVRNISETTRQSGSKIRVLSLSDALRAVASHVA